MMQKGISVTYESISKVVADKLKSYIKPVKTLLSTTPHITQQYANNRAENSHQSTRLREKKMRRFKSIKQAQLFLSSFGNIYDHFNCGRYLCSAKTFRILAEHRFKKWDLWTKMAYYGEEIEAGSKGIKGKKYPGYTFWVQGHLMKLISKLKYT